MGVTLPRRNEVYGANMRVFAIPRVITHSCFDFCFLVFVVCMFYTGQGRSDVVWLFNSMFVKPEGLVAVNRTKIDEKGQIYLKPLTG
jgi:hypothetical protein